MNDEEALEIIRREIQDGVVHTGSQVLKTAEEVLACYKAGGMMRGQYAGLENVWLSRSWPNIQMTSRAQVVEGIETQKSRHSEDIAIREIKADE